MRPIAVQEADAAVVQEANKRSPAVEQVVNSLCSIVARGEQRSLLAHPDFEIGDDRPRLITTSRKPLFRRFAVDSALDLKQDIDASHGFAGNRRLSRFLQVEELSAAVAPTGSFKERSRLPLCLVELVIPIEGLWVHLADGCGGTSGTARTGRSVSSLPPSHYFSAALIRLASLCPASATWASATDFAFERYAASRS
ncbi:hypothetical protein ACVI1I_006325 [Bradyrhizobium sp. USDA 4459]